MIKNFYDYSRVVLNLIMPQKARNHYARSNVLCPPAKGQKGAMRIVPEALRDKQRRNRILQGKTEPERKTILAGVWQGNRTTDRPD